MEQSSDQFSKVIKNSNITNTTELKHDLLEYFYQYMAITKTHGLSNIVNTQTRIGRMIWTILFFIALSIMSINIYYLGRSFDSNSVTTSIETSTAPLELPAITICKLSTFYDGFCGKMNGLYEKFNLFFNLTKKYFNETEIKSPYPITRLFLQNNFRKLAFINAEVVYSCNMTDRLCDYNNFSEIYNPELGNCITTTNYSNEAIILNKNNALVLTLWIFSFIDKYTTLFSASEAFQDELLAFYIHPQGTYPPLDDAPTEVLLRSASEIISLNQNIYEKDPDSKSYETRCLLSEELGNKDFYLLSNLYRPVVRYKYNRQTCIYVSKQNYVAEKCGCLSEKFPIPENLTSYRFCHEVPLEEMMYQKRLEFFFKNNLTKNYFCHKTALNFFNKLYMINNRLDYLCPYKCKTNIYNIKNTRFSKRRESKEVHQYMDFKLNRADALKKKIGNYSCGSPYEIISADKLKNIVFIHYATENTLLFELSNEASLYYKDTIEVSPYQFLANIGGVLGIYIGMSILGIFEVFELIFSLLFVVFREKIRTLISRNYAIPK